MKLESIQVNNETLQNYKKLLDLAQPDDSLLLLMYGSPDPDAIASAMALREILRRKKGLSRCAFAATEPIRRQQNKELVQAMRISIRLINQIDWRAYRLVALIDAQPTFFNDEEVIINPQIVFDHHPRKGDWLAEVSDIRPHYGALSTVLTEYLLCARIRIPRNLHTALLYGIKTDTDNFDRDTSPEDIGAYTYHSRFANLRLIRRIELNQTPASFLKYFDFARRHMKCYRGRRAGFIGQVESPDACVQVADFYLRLIGTYYVIVAGIVNDRLVIIFRSDGYRQDCGAAARKACGYLGQGGGHRSAARIEISLNVLKEELKGDLSQKNVENFLKECLKKDKKRKASDTLTKPEKERI